VVLKQATTRLPICSALFEQLTGELVVRWVTTSKYPLLYVSAIFLFVCSLDDYISITTGKDQAHDVVSQQRS
jgi:hypothetical protein